MYELFNNTMSISRYDDPINDGRTDQHGAATKRVKLQGRAQLVNQHKSSKDITELCKAVLERRNLATWVEAMKISKNLSCVIAFAIASKKEWLFDIALGSRAETLNRTDNLKCCRLSNSLRLATETQSGDFHDLVQLLRGDKATSELVETSIENLLNEISTVPENVITHNDSAGEEIGALFKSDAMANNEGAHTVGSKRTNEGGEASSSKKKAKKSKSRRGGDSMVLDDVGEGSSAVGRMD